MSVMLLVSLGSVISVHACKGKERERTTYNINYALHDSSRLSLIWMRGITHSLMSVLIAAELNTRVP